MSHNALIKCYQIIHVWILEFNGYLMVYFFQRGLSVHVQRALKISRVYTLAEILSIIFVQSKRQLGTLFMIIV